MLKIEKQSSSKPINLSIRENTRLFTPTFLQALTVTLFLHVSAIILFHVQPFRINQTNTQFPPVQVNIEIALPDSAIFAELEEPKSHHIAIPEPSWPKPSIPYMTLNSPDHFEIFSNESIFPMDSFTLDFHDQLEGFWVNLDPAPLAQKKAPQIYILGPLANRPIVAGTLPEPLKQSKKSQVKHLLYTVNIDDESGKIFSYQSQYNPNDRKMEERAAQILETIQFEPITMGFVSKGEIEIILSGGSR